MTPKRACRAVFFNVDRHIKGKTVSIGSKDVVWAYRMILGREPESRFVVDIHSALADVAELRRVLFNSQEFRTTNKVLDFSEKWVCCEVYKGTYRIWVDLGDKYISYGCLLDDYEPLETQFIRDNVKEGQAVLDIGANVGWHMLGLANAVGETGSVCVFEPRLPTVEYLRRTIRENNLENLIDLHALGLWDEVRQARLVWADATTNPGHTFVDAGGTSKEGKQDIELRVLDELALPKIDFIKIDIEGAEARALSGARELLSNDRPIILSELYPDQLQDVSGVSARDYVGSICKIGYTCHLLEHNFVSRRIDDFPADFGRELTNVVFVPEGGAVVFP